MKGFGITTAFIGALMAALSLFMKTSIHNDATYNEIGFQPASDIINIGLLQNQQLVFLAGCFVFLAGVVISSTGFAISAFRDGPHGYAAFEPAADNVAAEE